MKPSAVLSKIGLDPFIVEILLMVFLGYFFPEISEIKNPFSLQQLSDFGVAGIFFFYGLKLNLTQLKSDLSNWKLHLLIQSITFLLFPIIVLLFYPLFNSSDYLTIWLGFFFLASLPSTVSSSVVMVSIANGNMPSAIFNASISSILGILFTPLWMSIFLQEMNENIDYSSIIFKLFLQVILPIVFGILLNKKWGTWAQTKKSQLKKFDQAIILIIVYSSFSHFFVNKMQENISTQMFIILIIGVIFLLFLTYSISLFISKKAGFSKADETTLLFCGSKKSLVHGAVMSKVLFGALPIASIIILPIMIYHAVQLIVISFIAKKRS